jgi:hypothetical protein
MIDFTEAQNKLTELINSLTPEQKVQYNVINQKIIAVQKDEKLTPQEKIERINQIAKDYANQHIK